LINSWKRESIFGACLIETSVVNAHPKLSNFFMDEVLPLNRLLPRFLLDWSGIGVDLQIVLDHLPRDPGHLRWLQGKHINITLEEGDEREFLFVT
jgi:hypothetical protein